MSSPDQSDATLRSNPPSTETISADPTHEPTVSDDNWVCLNGHCLPRSQAQVSAGNLGLLRGWGLFETMLAVDGTLLLWPEHAARLQAGARQLGLAVPDLADLERGWRQLWERYSARPTVPDAESRPSATQGRALDRAKTFQDTREPAGLTGDWPFSAGQRGARVRLTLTAASEWEQGREPANSATGGADRMPSDYLISFEPVALPIPISQQPGMRLVAYPGPFSVAGPSVGCKHTSYLPWALAYRYATQQGADDAILCDGSGQIVETSRRNVFLVKGRRLRTPALTSGCLPGVMRSRVIACAPRLGFDVEQQPVTWRDWEEADYVLLTAAVSGPVWVRVWEQQRFTRPDDPRLEQLAAAVWRRHS